MSVYSLYGVELKNVRNVKGAVVGASHATNGVTISTVQGTDFCAMSYNVQWWGGINRLQDVTNAIFTTHNPDVVGFQEYKDKATYLSELGFSSVQISDATFATNLKCVAAKYPISDVSEKTFDVYKSETRSYQRMYIDVAGIRICIVNTHLDFAPKTTQYAQAKELFSVVKDEPYFILMGDFNTFCKSVADADYMQMMKQFDDAGCQLANCSNQHGFFDTWSDGVDESATDWWQTDNVITSGNIFIKSVLVDKSKITAATGEKIDHLPIVARLVIT